jgi:3-hydroxyacyl-[acyl-carrier-protein] dehydratase
MIDSREIMGLIPHRYPFLLIDKIVEFEENKSILSIKNVTINENFFQGHFPDFPVMPGVLIVEAMAQTAAVLIAKSTGASSESKLVYFMSIENAKFRQVVKPGDVLSLKIEIMQSRAFVWKFKGVAYVENNIVAESNFTAMIKDR